MEWIGRLKEYIKSKSINSQFFHSDNSSQATCSRPAIPGRGHKDPLYLEGPRNHRHVCTIICVRKLQKIYTLNTMEMEILWTHKNNQGNTETLVITIENEIVMPEQSQIESMAYRNELSYGKRIKSHRILFCTTLFHNKEDSHKKIYW